MRSVGVLCQPVAPVSMVSSLQHVADRMRMHGLTAVPVIDGGAIAGVIDEQDLVHALSSGFEPTAPVSVLPLTNLPMLYANATGAEALRMFESQKKKCALVVDQQLNLVGLLTPAHLYPHLPPGLRPTQIGGMATPVGVYLTNGAQSGGANFVGLGLAGALLCTIQVVSTYGSDAIGQGLLKMNVAPNLVTNLLPVFALMLFFLLLRLHPLTGYHAAEHMVVHAIERGEELHPDIVRRMPRVHPRCGTNLATAMSLFFAVMFSPWSADQEMKLLVAVLVTMFLWRPLGSFMQEFLTTRPPNKKQLEAGIKAGTELLRKYEENPIVAPSPLQKFLFSGMPALLVGFVGTLFVLDQLARLLKLPGLIE